MINCIKALKETTAAVNEKPNLSKFLQLISQNHQYGSHSIITFFVWWWGAGGQREKIGFYFSRYTFCKGRDARVHLRGVVENLFFFLISISEILSFSCFIIYLFKYMFSLSIVLQISLLTFLRRMWLAPGPREAYRHGLEGGNPEGLWWWYKSEMLSKSWLCPGRCFIIATPVKENWYCLWLFWADEDSSLGDPSDLPAQGPLISSSKRWGQRKRSIVLSKCFTGKQNTFPVPPMPTGWNQE